MNNGIDLDTIYKEFRTKHESSKPIYVSLYEVDRCYGGPEEGGWWYDAYHLLSTKKFFDAEEAQTFCDALNQSIEKSGLNDEDLSSSRGFDQYPDPSNGDPMYDHSDDDIPIGFSGLATNQRAYVEDVAGENETKEVPHYE